jgi:hypothetical protein
MKPVMQTHLGRGPAFGEPHGNCLQASLASVFELPLEQVPHFVIEPEETWWSTLQAWSRARFGLDVLAFPASKADGWTPDGFHLVTGYAPTPHATVGYRGRVVHDPHPSQAPGQTKLHEDGRLWWMFMAINPAQFSRGIAAQPFPPVAFHPDAFAIALAPLAVTE